MRAHTHTNTYKHTQIVNINSSVNDFCHSAIDAHSLQNNFVIYMDMDAVQMHILKKYLEPIKLKAIKHK